MGFLNCKRGFLKKELCFLSIACELQIENSGGIEKLEVRTSLHHFSHERDLIETIDIDVSETFRISM